MNIRHVYLLLALAGALTSSAWGLESTTTLKFSDPTKPGTLKVNLMGGDLHILAGDTPDITVVSDAKAGNSQKRSDGLRVIGGATSFTFEEKNNVVTLEAGYGRHHGSTNSYKVTVPKNTAVVVLNQYGDTSCAGVGGDVEVRSNNGGVTLKDVMSGASVETMNGGIHVSVKTLMPNHALSFSSMNGEIVIHLPAASQANLQLRTQNGSILTDFDDNDLVTKVTGQSGTGVGDSQFRDAIRQVTDAAREAARAAREAARQAVDGGGGPVPPIPPLPPLPPMTGGQTVSGILHGGGTEVQAATMNGDVTVRKE